MSVEITSLDVLFAGRVWTLNLKFKDQSSDRDVWLEGTNYAHVAQRAASCISDALLTEQIVTAWRFNGILIDIQADWTDPSIIGKA